MGIHTKIIGDTKDCSVCRERKPLTEFNIDSRKAKHEARYGSNPYRAECRSCGTQQTVNARTKRDAEELAVIRKARHLRLKTECFAAYGSVCACCGESEIMFLSIDHVNNDGHVERKEHGLSTTNQYKRIIDAGCPDTYRVLCFNCNLGRAANGGICPHGTTENNIDGQPSE